MNPFQRGTEVEEAKCPDLGELYLHKTRLNKCQQKTCQMLQLHSVNVTKIDAKRVDMLSMTSTPHWKKAIGFSIRWMLCLSSQESCSPGLWKTENILKVCLQTTELKRETGRLLHAKGAATGEGYIRPGSHGCKIWLFVREVLQFPWILQQNLEAAARSKEKREAARRAASRAAAAEKCAGCSACNVRSRSSSFVFSFLFFF